MADIRSKILNKFDIDIAQENVFKLYKIKQADLSDAALNAAIQETRGRWQQSVDTGTNEKFVARDKERLEKADRYEAILRDAKLRKELANYYNGGKGGSSVGNSADTAGDPEMVQFARDYFRIVATSKKIKQSDVDFFFKYYKKLSKSKKAILAMLAEEYKIRGLDKTDKDDEQEDVESLDTESGVIVRNLFADKTILNVRKALDMFEAAVANSELCNADPDIQGETLYQYLHLDRLDDVDAFLKEIDARNKVAIDNINEHGKREYDLLRDLYNQLATLGKNREIQDNYPEFRLLIKYPDLTPFMFAFVEMRKETLTEITNIAKQQYGFRNQDDFIINYYSQIYDNFNINNSKIEKILRTAEKNAQKTRIVSGLEERLGIRKGVGLPLGVRILHGLVYWPIFVMFLIFEVIKGAFTRIGILQWPLFVVLFLLEQYSLGQSWVNLLYLRFITDSEKWDIVASAFSLVNPRANAFETVMASIIGIIVLSAVSIIPPLFASMFIASFSEYFNKRFDWNGLERTFKKFLNTAKSNTTRVYKEDKRRIVVNLLPHILVNLLCVAIIIAIIILIPMGIERFL